MNVWYKTCHEYKIEKALPPVREILEESGLAGRVTKGTRVLLKPNLLRGAEPGRAVTTHPVLLEAVVRALQDRGARVKIFDSPGGPFTKWMLKSVYKATGLQDLAARTGVELNWDTRVVSIKNPRGKYIKQLEVAAAAVETDLLINMPKFKTHGLTMISGAVKNLFGCIPGLQKPEYHMRFPDAGDFCDALIDIALALPAFVIMDAVAGMEGPGPGAGTPREMGVVIAGDDPFAVDLVMADMVNLAVDDIQLLQAAARRDLLPQLSGIRIYGREEMRDRILDWKLPPTAGRISAIGNMIPEKLRRFALKHFQPRTRIIEKACRGCAECVRSCPAKCMRIVNQKARIDQSRCIHCFCCQELCPYHAVEIKRSLPARLLLKI